MWWPMGLAVYSLLVGVLALSLSAVLALQGGLGEAWPLPLLGIFSFGYGAAEAGWLNPGSGRRRGRGRHEP